MNFQLSTMPLLIMKFYYLFNSPHDTLFSTVPTSCPFPVTANLSLFQYILFYPDRKYLQAVQMAGIHRNKQLEELPEGQSIR